MNMLGAFDRETFGHMIVFHLAAHRNLATFAIGLLKRMAHETIAD